MDCKIPKYIGVEMSRRKEEKAEKKRAQLKRRAGLNFALDNTAMKKAGILPLSRRQMEKANKIGLEEDAKLSPNCLCLKKALQKGDLRGGLLEQSPLSFLSSRSTLK